MGCATSTAAIGSKAVPHWSKTTPATSSSSTSMRILFTVQGEGRGHLTQALAVQQSLSRLGHELVAVVAGRNSVRALPEFFRRSFEVPVIELPSPGFVFRDHRSVALAATLGRALRELPV